MVTWKNFVYLMVDCVFLVGIFLCFVFSLILNQLKRLPQQKVLYFEKTFQNDINQIKQQHHFSILTWTDNKTSVQYNVIVLSFSSTESSLILILILILSFLKDSWRVFRTEENVILKNIDKISVEKNNLESVGWKRKTWKLKNAKIEHEQPNTEKILKTEEILKFLDVKENQNIKDSLKFFKFLK